MSPILDIAHGLPRVGKIRLGIEVEAAGGKMRPSKLDTFRLTSPDEQVIIAAAAIPELGGEPRQWDNDGAPEFEVVTNASVLDVLITPEDDAFSQHYELWSGGGCQRRCDGFHEHLSGEACKCPADLQVRSEQSKLLKPTACKPTTRVSVVLPQIPRIGSWLLETHGYYAAKELGSTFALLDMAGARRNLLPARLRIEQRVSKKPGQPINKYGVPVLDIGMRFDELVNASALPAFDAATGEVGPFDNQPALPAAEPVTSTKKAAARKQAAEKRPATDDPTPMDEAEVQAVRDRVTALDDEHRYFCVHALNNQRITLKAGPPKKSEAKKIDTVIAAFEALQAAAWEARRAAVFGAIAPFEFNEKQRHESQTNAAVAAAADLANIGAAS